ncbi:MAG: FAD:protein FMN transferase [bacterium]
MVGTSHRILFALLIAFASGSALSSELTTHTAVQPQIVGGQFPMMGTFVEIKVVAESDRVEETQKTIQTALAAMQEYVDVVSTWDPRSDASKINANAGKQPVKIDARLMRLLVHAKEISEMSGGALDITMAPLGKIWDLKADKPLIPNEEQIAETRNLVNYKDLILDGEKGTAFLRREGMRIDLGAIAKGAAVDVGIASLRRSGINRALINAGGDLYAMGSKPDGPWRLGIRAPREERGKLLTFLNVENKGVATSGDYEKMVIINGKRYHHILDPRTGRSADRCVSVTVIAEDAETADGLATALFVLGPEDGLGLCERLPKVEALIINSSFGIFRTSNFPTTQPQASE